jgi:hypothetical protein
LAKPQQKKAEAEPEWSLAIPYILALPLKNIEDMQNPIISPVLVQYTI